MRVLFHLLDSGLGGGQRVALNIAEGLIERGHTVGLVVPTSGPTLEAFRAMGATTHLVDGGTLRRPLSVVRLARVLRGYDVLYSHTEIPGVIIGATAARLTRPTHVVHQHNAPYFSASSRIRVLQKELFRTLAGRATFIAVAAHVGEGLLAAGIQSNRVNVVPNGVGPLDVPPPHEATTVTVGVLARLDPRKNVDVFVEAATLVRPGTAMRYLVGGASGPFEEYEAALRLQANRAGIEIDPAPDGVAFLRELDIVVIPSSYEGSPLVLFEAMALGRAVIASDIPGIREVIGPSNAGVLVPPRNAEALAAAIADLIDDPARRLELGVRGREIATTDYSLSTVVARTIAILELAARAQH